jgi:hypothetical protein
MGTLPIGVCPADINCEPEAPTPRSPDVDFTWESLSGRGAVAPMQCVTEGDGQAVDVGDIPLKRGFSLSGRVVLSDGKPIAEGMSMLIALDRVPQTAVVPLPADGRFELRGLAAGAYTLEPAVRGYEVPEGVFIDVLVKHSVSDYGVRLEPAPAAPVQ